MADISKKEGKMAVKKPKEQDDNILSDSDSSQGHLECDTCGVNFTDLKSYESHLRGKKHQKKVSEAKLIAKHLASDKSDENSDEDDEHSTDIRCEVCNKDISGYRSYLGHLKGSVHAKNVKKQKLKEQLKDMPEVLGDKASGSDDDDCLAKPYARCATCEKAFSGPESFNKHLKSTAHKKKVKNSQSLQTLKAKYDGARKPDDDDDEFFSKCDVCQKSFSGHIPFQIHMASAAHKRSLERQKVAEEVKHLCLNEDTTDGYVCRECRKVFGDPLSFKSHLQNNSHEKRKAKDLLKEFLAAYPEILFVTPLDNKADSDDESDAEDGSDSQYYLICKLCHMSFSGPESAQDHVKSKKHISLKKEKKMLKFLKEQSNEKNKAAKDPKSAASGSTANDRLKSPEKSSYVGDFEII